MKNGGAIVNACSVAGLSGSGGSAEYVASKHGESLKKPESVHRDSFAVAPRVG